MNNQILGIQIGIAKISEIVNCAITFWNFPKEKFHHIVNLNPDIFMFAYNDSEYRLIVNSADSILIDGVGITIAARIAGIASGERMTGTDLMPILVKSAIEKKKKVMFLGGNDNTAELTGTYFKKLYPSLQYISHPGAVTIKKETEKENREVIAIIKKFQPDLLFVAYGPPFQEKWIYNNREDLKGIVCMGVGGAFKLISGQVPRAPKWFIKHGLEWIWRFASEPKRMLQKLPRHMFFLFLIIKLMFDKFF